jgi:GT2 family glycosyltransferase
MLSTPSFSIIIPTYNRPRELQLCLNAIAQIDYPRDRFEVVVVDDGSPNTLDSVVDPFRHRLNVQLIRQKNSGPASARNTGAKHARGEFLAFTDDDCAPTPMWLQAMANALTYTPDALVGGHIINALEKNIFSNASQQLVSYLYNYYNAKHDGGFFCSNNFAVAAARFVAMGGFSTDYPRAAGEDRDFCDRWLEHGYPMVYTEQAVIYHFHRLTLQKFWRQHMNYGRGAYTFHRLHALRGQKPIRVEPLSFYFGLVWYPFKQTKVVQAVPLSFLIGIAQVANVLGFFIERNQQRRADLLINTDTAIS